MNLTRRALLAAAPLTAALPGTGSATAPAALTADWRVIEVNGRAARVLGLTGPGGRPGITLDPGARFAVGLTNRTDDPTIVHWHGQTPPARQDGVALTGLERLISPGATRHYDFAPRAGTHWMHSHHGLQEQRLMAAPLIVRRAADTKLREITLLLQDFSFRAPSEILAGLRRSSAMTGMGGMAAGSMTMTAMPSARGETAAPDLNDVDFDAYLANDRTLADPDTVFVTPGETIHLRVINAAASTGFWLSAAGLDALLVAVDGDPVHQLRVARVPLAEAQRADLLLRVPARGGAFAVLAQREGDRQRTGLILATPGARIGRIAAEAAAPEGALGTAFEHRLRARHSLAPRAPDLRQTVRLGGSMMPYRWTIDGRTWPEHLPIRVSHGQRVVLDLINETGMSHPMHMHGHHFQLIALDGVPLSGAMRDTVLVPAHGRVSIAFDAANPGRWPFHCHNLYHMAAGMMTEIVYASFA